MSVPINGCGQLRCSFQKHAARHNQPPYTARTPRTRYHIYGGSLRETPHPPSLALRVAAIGFLNPAPLLWDFEHPPLASALSERYAVHYTQPAICAEQLLSGEADLGLVPIGALPFLPEVDVVPGCTIASLHRVRSIQLVLRPGVQLRHVRSIAADAASRSSVAYLRLLLHDAGNAVATTATRAKRIAPAIQAWCASSHSGPNSAAPQLHPSSTSTGDLPAMLSSCEGALLIGDPALFALERRDRSGEFRDCTWIDIAELWTESTHLPWVAAVWAVRRDAFTRCNITARQLTCDLAASRDHGLQNIPQLVQLWSQRLALPASTVHSYLTGNIHYHLDAACLAGARQFFLRSAQTGLLPAYELSLLADDTDSLSADGTATSPQL